MKNSTRVMARPATAVLTVATTLRVAPAGSVVPVAALMPGVTPRAMAGAELSVTVTLEAAETVALVLSSVAMATIDAGPMAVGVHAVLQMRFARAVPGRRIPLAKTSTREIVPSVSAAMTLTVVTKPEVAKAPSVGVRTRTVGAAPMAATSVTLTALEVVVRPLLSVTMAVNWWAPTSVLAT